jgi:hypothetical protein
LTTAQRMILKKDQLQRSNEDFLRNKEEKSHIRS